MKKEHWYWLAAAAGVGALVVFKGSDAMARVVTESDAFTAYDDMFKAQARRWGVPWRWQKAIAMNESNLGQDPLVIQQLWSSDGKSRGIMQLTPDTAKWISELYGLPYSGADEELDDPRISIEIAAAYLHYLFQRFNGDQESVVRGYNGGPGFRQTVAGQRDTPAYYARFLRNLARILEKQPGDPRALDS